MRRIRECSMRVYTLHEPGTHPTCVSEMTRAAGPSRGKSFGTPRDALRRGKSEQIGFGVYTAARWGDDGKTDLSIVAVRVQMLAAGAI